MAAVVFVAHTTIEGSTPTGCGGMSDGQSPRQSDELPEDSSGLLESDLLPKGESLESTHL